MKTVLYVMVNRAGKIKTFEINTVQQYEADNVNLKLFEPDKLRGNSRIRFTRLLSLGFSLSNWHVIEHADSEAT